MAREAAARKRRTTPEPMQAVAISLSSDAGKRTATAQNWRHAMSTRGRMMFRRHFAASAGRKA